MFVEALRNVVESTEGALAALLMDSEGIELASYAKKNIDFNITVIGVEFSVVVKSVQRAVESLEAGQTREIAILADRVVTVFRVLTKDYFVALALTPGANIGKARYMLRLAAPQLTEELG